MTHPLRGLDILDAWERAKPDIEKLAAQPGLQTLARLIAYYGVRNSELENLHAELEGFHDGRMRSLMLNIEKEIGEYLAWLILNGVLRVRKKPATLLELMDWHDVLLCGPSYDRVDWPQ